MKVALSVEGRDYGILSQREQEIFAAGELAAQAKLYRKVELLRHQALSTFDGYTGQDALNDVLALLRGDGGA
jgi:hypothetical protein